MAIVRQIIFAIDPETDESTTLSYSAVPDYNDDGYMFSCAFVPPAKGTAVNLLQETMFLGTQDAGITLQTLRDDLSMDGSSSIVATAITSAIDPETVAVERRDLRTRTTKRFRNISFGGNVIPEAVGATICYCKDADPSSESVTWETFGGSAADRVRYFKSGIAERIHLKIVDNVARVNQPVLSAFEIEYYNLRR